MTEPGPVGPPPPHAPGYGPIEPAHGVPAPPPGPGATPPFAAPPAEGRTFRMWLGIGVAALAVLLCCGGGTVALLGLGVATSQAVNEQARRVVGDYLADVSHGRYDQAYGLLCPDAQARETQSDFQRRVSAEPHIASYRVHNAEGTSQITVPADVTYDGGSRATLRFHLTQDSRTGRLEVCGIS